MFVAGTGLDQAVNIDDMKVESEYNEEALPFIKQHTSLGFDANIHTLQLYRHMVGLLDGIKQQAPGSQCLQFHFVPL